MKSNHTFALVAACGTFVLFTGCGNNDTATPPTTEIAPTPTTSAADQAAQAADANKEKEALKAAELARADALQQQADAEKLAAGKAAADKLAVAAAAATQEQDRIQGLIDTAKNLTGENKYVEALKVLGELSKLELSPEQQAAVDALKKTAEQQAAKAVTDEAVAKTSKAIGGALGGRQ